MTQENSFVDVTKYAQRFDYNIKHQGWSQQKTIESILVTAYYDEENKPRIAPKIFVPDLKLLGYKNPETALKALEKKGVIKILHGLQKEEGDEIELNTRVVYCNECRTREVFYWDRWNHLAVHHNWSKYNLEWSSARGQLVEDKTKGLHPAYIHNIWETEFSSKPYPDKEDHDYEQDGPLHDNRINVRCRKCGDERTVYIDNVRNECDPYDKSIYIDNPTANELINVRKGRNSQYITVTDKKALDDFVMATLEELEQ